MRRAILLTVSLVALSFAAAALGWSAAPRSDEQGYDPAYAGWFQSLQRPDQAGGCCDAADCRAVNWRIAQGGAGYEIQPNPVYDDRVRDAEWDRAEWFRVPPEKVLRTSNPTGDAIGCYSIKRTFGAAAGIIILCFVPDDLV